MIELQNYKKVTTTSEFVKFQVQQEHNKSKTITLAVALMLLSVFVLSLQVCFTEVNVDDFNLKVFNDDQDKVSLKAFFNFMLKYGKPYSSRLHMAKRYRIFKANYLIVMNHNKQVDTVPSLLEINQFTDMTQYEFEMSHTGLRLPDYYNTRV